ncbi:alpha/beta hydrolase [Kineococcus glutinatus]|uniref:3-oxoadipate enol-lactonase n=1 Tax=Kineococcus glutinatus TaxID=1070872 RepID=A0ABP9HBE2_9ACTN
MPRIARDGAQVWWDERGSGEPVLLVQGLGYPCDMWHLLLPELARRHRVLVLDNRGVGRTGVPPGPYPVEVMAADAAAVLEAAGETSAHVVGVSMGGLIAQELALGRPELVRSLALGCTHPGGADSVFSPEAGELLGGRAAMTPEEAAEASVPFVYAPTTPRERIDTDLAVRRAVPTWPAGYLAQLTGSAAYAGALSRLPGLGMPVLLVHGTADRLVPVENTRILARALPAARLELLEGAGHIFWTDQPRETLRLLLEWFATAA